jgi:hypothetical protein
MQSVIASADTVPDSDYRAIATLAQRRPTLRPIVRRHLRKFEASPSKALLARARHIRERLAKSTAK